jgi:protein-S-isoprenylcysteine O-methyltransferase Ste14
MSEATGDRELPGWLFRSARPARAAWNLLKTYIQVAVVWTVALGLLPWIAVTVQSWLGVGRWEWALQAPLGIALFLLASTVGVWSAWLMATIGEGTPVPFDAARHLVVVGPYRVIRNPMAVTGIVQLLGVSLALGSAFSLLVAAGGAGLWQWVIRPPEERYLEREFGNPYRQYRAAVRCWIPRWPPYPRLPERPSAAR